MNVLSIPHEPTPLVMLQVYLPYGTAVSEQSFATWRDAAWNTFVRAADERLKAAVEKLVSVVPYIDLVVTRDVIGDPAIPHPKIDARVALGENASLLPRVDEAPCFAVVTRNADDFDPLPFLLAWTTAVAIAEHEGGIVYAHRAGRLWDPRREALRPIAGALCVRDFLEFDAHADEESSYACSVGLPWFGLPELTWSAPSGTDAAGMRNLLIGAASGLLRARRKAGRQNAGQTSLDVPAMFPVLFGDIAAAWGIDADRMDPTPDTQLASVPLDLSTDLALAINTNASARALNDWLAGIRENVARIRVQGA